MFADVRREGLQVATELLLARAPEVIIESYAAAGWTPTRVAGERDVWRALPSLPAVRTGRIYVLADDRLGIPGPRVAEAVRLIANVLHGKGRGALLPGDLPTHEIDEPAPVPLPHGEEGVLVSLAERVRHQPGSELARVLGKQAGRQLRLGRRER